MRIVFGSFLAGAVGGGVLGDAMADHQEYSKGDSYVLRETALLGLGATWGISDMADASSEGIEVAFIAGPALGLWLGHRLTRDVNFTPSQGTLIGLSELGGALLGLGIGYLIEVDESGGYITLGTAGGAAGFALAYHAFRPNATNEHKHSLFELQLAPQSLMTYGAGGQRRVVPGVGATIRF